MRKLKTLSTVLAATVAASAIGMFAMTGCGAKKVEVSTYEQLISEENAKKSVILTADIDCGGNTITSLPFKEIDGQNHTIKNGVISTTEYDYIAGSLFCSETEVIQNLNVEDFDVTGFYSAAIIKHGGGGEIHNVHVKNCTLNATGCYYAGGIYAGYYKREQHSIFDSGSQTDGASVYDCTVDNLTMDIVTDEWKTFSFSKEEVFVGGIAGTNANRMKNCHITNSNITAKSLCDCYSMRVGGIVGQTLNISECSSSDNVITGNAAVWGDAKAVVSSDSTSDLYIGGAVGELLYSDSVRYCFSDGNEINAKSSGTLFAGGFAGRLQISTADEGQENIILECYSVNNNVAAGSFAASALKCEDYRYCGGFIGFIRTEDTTSDGSFYEVQSCFAYNNDVNDSSYDQAGSKDSKNELYDDAFYYGGFVSTAKSSKFKNCAASATSSASPYDVFSNNVKLVTGCYIPVGKVSGTSVDFLESEEWLGESLKTKLSLNYEKWNFEAGKLPSLKLV